MQKDGDEGEDVEPLIDSLSRFRVSDDPSLNPYAAAYIVPDFTWAASYNNSNVPFNLFGACSTGACPELRNLISANNGSQASENDDFWIGYLLFGYQGSDYLNDTDRNGFTGGFAPYRADATRVNEDNYNQSVGVPPGGIGAVVFVESIRDRYITPIAANELPLTFARTRTAPHEVGHQFGLNHNVFIVGDGGLMGYTGELFFTPNHINMIRWRVKSPGEGN